MEHGCEGRMRECRIPGIRLVPVHIEREEKFDARLYRRMCFLMSRHVAILTSRWRIKERTSSYGETRFSPTYPAFSAEDTRLF
jgi:hypothetical protein